MKALLQHPPLILHFLINFMQVEKRGIAIELRAAGRRLEGYAATFGIEAKIGGFTEVIAAGAFAESLKSNDILALVDHDPTRLLARTRSNTLRLSEDSKGLAFSLNIPDTQTGKDILALAERSDLGGMSFGFTVPKNGEVWIGNRRELLAVNLHEISVVAAWPAYNGTIIHARNKQIKTMNDYRLDLMRMRA